jgi:hypothetical protein
VLISSEVTFILVGLLKQLPTGAASPLADLVGCVCFETGLSVDEQRDSDLCVAEVRSSVAGSALMGCMEPSPFAVDVSASASFDDMAVRPDDVDFELLVTAGPTSR